MPRTKVVGIVHEWGGDPDNIDACGEFCRLVLSHVPDVVVLSPLHMFGFLDDRDQADRRLGIRVWRRVILLCDEVWTVGSCASEGCRGDLAACEAAGVPVYNGYERMDELAPGWRLAMP